MRKRQRRDERDRKSEIVTLLSEDSPTQDERVRKQFAKPDVKHAIFNEDNGKQKLDFFSCGSLIVSCGDGDAGVVVCNEIRDIIRIQGECEDLSLIQIENQQSNLFDHLQSADAE